MSRVVRCSPRRSSVGTSAKDDAFRLDRTAHPLSSSFPLATQVVTNQPHDEEVALGSDTESSGDEAGVAVRPRSTRGTVFNFFFETRTTRTNAPEKKKIAPAPRAALTPALARFAPARSKRTGPAGRAAGSETRDARRRDASGTRGDERRRRDGFGDGGD